MTARLLALAVMAAPLAVVGCEEHEFHPPDRAEHVAQADSLYTPALFDTITWSSDSLRVARGNLVYADECRSCHGPLGEGDTEYARTRELDVPSLVEPDWPYAGDVDQVRRRIFAGHPDGMPTWGVGRLTPRQVDAVAVYLVDQLRPEVLGSGG